MIQFMFAILFPVQKRLFNFHSRGILEALPDLDDRVTISGEKRETISGDERDVIL